MTSPARSHRTVLGGVARRTQVGVWLTLILLLAACRQATPALDSVTQTVSPEGRTVALLGGVEATFEPGFVKAPAAVTLSVSDTPTPYPPAVVAEVGGGEPLAKTVTVTLPVDALAPLGSLLEQPTLMLRVPASVPRLEDEERMLAEVHLQLADGEHLILL